MQNQKAQYGQSSIKQAVVSPASSPRVAQDVLEVLKSHSPSLAYSQFTKLPNIINKAFFSHDSRTNGIWTHLDVISPEPEEILQCFPRIRPWGSWSKSSHFLFFSCSRHSFCPGPTVRLRALAPKGGSQPCQPSTVNSGDLHISPEQKH